MDITHKNYFKTNGLNHIRQLEADHLEAVEEDREHKIKLQQQEAELKRTLHGVLDPEHMDCNLPEPHDTGGISFDPDDMDFGNL